MSLIIPNNIQQVNITIHEGKVVVQFLRPTTEMVMTVQDAADFSRKLAQVTAECYKLHHSADDYSLN